MSCEPDLLADDDDLTSVSDGEISLDDHSTLVVPATLDATCGCIQAPPILATSPGTHVVSVTARGAGGSSTPATPSFVK